MLFSVSVFAEKNINLFIVLDKHLITSHSDDMTVVYEKGTITLKENYQIFSEEKKPNPLIKIFKKKVLISKKIKVAALAFPFPFGIVGLHRIYLGTSPYVPVAYIGTAGGVFGILPLIDFFKILLDKNIEPYQNNGKVFMWIKD